MALLRYHVDGPHVLFELELINITWFVVIDVISMLHFYIIIIPGLAQDADVLVHEATNTFLPGVDKDGNMRLVTRDAKIHGHSTPFMVSQNQHYCSINVVFVTIFLTVFQCQFRLVILQSVSTPRNWY